MVKPAEDLGGGARSEPSTSWISSSSGSGGLASVWREDWMSAAARRRAVEAAPLQLAQRLWPIWDSCRAPACMGAVIRARLSGD